MRFENIKKVDKEYSVIPDVNEILFNHYLISAKNQTGIVTDFVVSNFFKDIVTPLKKKQEAYGKMYSEDCYKCFVEKFSIKIHTLPSPYPNPPITKKLNVVVTYLEKRKIKVEIKNSAKRLLTTLIMSTEKIVITNMEKTIAYLVNTSVDKVKTPVEVSIQVLKDTIEYKDILHYSTKEDEKKTEGVQIHVGSYPLPMSSINHTI